MVNMLSRLFSSEVGQRIYDKATSFVIRCGIDKYISRGVLVGLSGGADSVMLLLYLLEYRRRNQDFKVTVAHINHGIRGSEADFDEEFSKKLCDECGVEFISKRYDIPSLSKERGEGLEECARNVRYSAFDEIISSRNDLFAIATAHHIGDNAETVILNMLRGAGTLGISGIPPIRDNIIRPLLSVAKSEILEALSLAGISFVTDSTNLSNEYKRNYIRNVIIPSMREVSDSPEAMISRLSANARCDNDFILSVAREFLRGREKIQNSELLSLHFAVFVRVLATMAEKCHAEISAKQAEAIYSLLSEDNFSYSITGAKFVCERGVCSIVTVSDEIIYDYNLPLTFGKTEVLGYDADIILSNAPLDKSSLNIYKISIQANLSSAIINGGLYIRPRREGDKIFYGGMTHKLKKLFNDRKIPNSCKAAVPVLCDGSGVVWVAGFGVRDDKTDDKASDKLYITLGIGKGKELFEPRLHSASEFKS